MYSEELYTDYFESLASSLSDLNHSELRPHFFINNETGKGLTELQNAIGGTLETPCLVLDEEDIESDGSGAGQKVNLVGGFAILDRIDPGDIASFRQVRNRTKRIARKIIQKMKRDSRASFDEDSPLLLANAIQIGEIRQYPTPIFFGLLSGWMVEFKWLLPEDINFGIEDFN